MFRHMTDHQQSTLNHQLLLRCNVLWLGEEARLRQAAFDSLRRARGYGAAGAALRSAIYFAMQMFLASVKNRNASSPPSRPTPLAFMAPYGTRRSRTSQQFTQTVPVWICSATRWARFRFCVQTLEARP